MRKIKGLLLPAAILSGMAVPVSLLHLVPVTWQASVYLSGAAAGLAPLALDVMQSLRQGKINLGIPVLITIGILLYMRQFLLADVFTLLILGGSLFKEFILWRVEQAVRNISRSLPDMAFRKTDVITKVHIQDIRMGDVLVVKAGARVPVDGILLSEEAVLDESVITGESRLITKGRGTRLVAGSINQASTFEMQVVSTSENSTLAQIHKLVEEAQRHGSQLSRFTERFALVNAGLALVGGIALYLVTRNLLQALAFWIALVPVVFAMIVPVATTIGISILAKKGILVKTGEALENITRINSIVFDKTGTLTRGTPEITRILILDGALDEKKLLALAASVENYSEHPLSRAFARKADAWHLEVPPAQDIQIIKGMGLQGTCQGRSVLIGSAQLVREGGMQIPAETAQLVNELAQTGDAPVYVLVDGRPAGIVFLTDLLRDQIGDTLASLRKMGMELTMITGDQKAVAEKVARELGLTRYYAETLPQDKLNMIRGFKASGERVAMIGDGINDAPAISEANVGIAMGLKGTDITLNSARVVLMNDHIEVLPYLIILSRKVLQIIRWDLYLASAIHLVAAALCVAGVISLLGSALIHQVSSVIVLLNTMRLFVLRK
ncbi:MAG TPA: cation-translocating P-type ATPase [Chitinophagaceae bacterium]|nr:cation-translocating P-type ATPase [Chitinophagaceae bacterium]